MSLSHLNAKCATAGPAMDTLLTPSLRIDPAMASTHAGGSKSVTPTSLDTLPHKIIVKILHYALVSPGQPVLLCNPAHRVKPDFRDKRTRKQHRAQPSQKLDVLLVSKAMYFAGI